MFSFGTSANNGDGLKGSNADRRAEFGQNLKALNDQFLSWVNEQDKTDVWIDGVEDYLTYAKQLLKDYDDVINSQVPSGTSAPVTATPALFGGSMTNTTTPAAPFGGFNFSAPSAPALGGFGGVSGTGTTTTAAAPEQEDEGDEEDKEESGPSVELDTSAANILFSKKVGLMSQDENTKKWKDRGSGILSIRQSKEGASALYIVFTTEAGRVLLTSPLKMKPVVNPKMPKNFIMMLHTQEDPQQPPKPGMHLFKCDSPDTQKEFVSKITELVQ